MTTKSHQFIISREKALNNPEGLIDMLRYDGATVESNAPEGKYLLACPHTPTTERWVSFGLMVDIVCTCKFCLSRRIS